MSCWRRNSVGTAAFDFINSGNFFIRASVRWYWSHHYNAITLCCYLLVSMQIKWRRGFVEKRFSFCSLYKKCMFRKCRQDEVKLKWNNRALYTDGKGRKELECLWCLKIRDIWRCSGGRNVLRCVTFNERESAHQTPHLRKQMCSRMSWDAR